MSLKSKMKFLIALIIIAIFGAFMFLNREEVNVNLIVAELKMNRALMVLGIFGSGFLLGWISHSIFQVRRPLKSD